MTPGLSVAIGFSNFKRSALKGHRRGCLKLVRVYCLACQSQREYRCEANVRFGCKRVAKAEVPSASGRRVEVLRLAVVKRQPYQGQAVHKPSFLSVRNAASASNDRRYREARWQRLYQWVLSKQQADGSRVTARAAATAGAFLTAALPLVMAGSWLA